MTEARIKVGRLHNGGFEARIEGRGLDGDTCLIADKDFPTMMARVRSAIAARFNLTPQEARVSAPSLPGHDPLSGHDLASDLDADAVSHRAEVAAEAQPSAWGDPKAPKKWSEGVAFQTAALSAYGKRPQPRIDFDLSRKLAAEHDAASAGDREQRRSYIDWMMAYLAYEYGDRGTSDAVGHAAREVVAGIWRDPLANVKNVDKWPDWFPKKRSGQFEKPKPAARALRIARATLTNEISLPPDAQIVSIEWFAEDGALMASVAYTTAEASQENSR